MTRWLPVAAAVVSWNVAFDYQVARAGERFTADQLARWYAGEEAALVRDAHLPRVRQAAQVSTGVAAFVLIAGVALRRRRAGPTER